MIPSKKPRMECLDGGTTTLLAGDAVDSNNNRSDTCGSTYGDRKSDHYDSKHHGNTQHENDHYDGKHHQSHLCDSKHQDRDHQDRKHQGQGRVGVGCRRPRVCAVKYQLRPRSLKSRYLRDPDSSLQDALDHKPRTPPLSRYRRKTANARERYRMRQINNAFENLRDMLPWWVCQRWAAMDMTKIATLRLASAYVRSLRDILDGNAPQDTSGWVLSSIFGEERQSQQLEVTHVDLDGVPSKAKPQPQQQQQQQQQQVAQDTDLFMLLCGPGEATPLDDLDTFSAGPSDSLTDPVKLFINCDPDIPWQQQQQQQQTLVT